jgi:hypothetical protein
LAGLRIRLTLPHARSLPTRIPPDYALSVSFQFVFSGGGATERKSGKHARVPFVPQGKNQRVRKVRNAGLVMAGFKPGPTRIGRCTDTPRGLTSVPTKRVGTGRELQSQKQRASRMPFDSAPFVPQGKQDKPALRQQAPPPQRNQADFAASC